MFTGIIQHVGRVVEARVASGGMKLRLDVGPLAEGLGKGASLAVDGACLTAAEVRPPQADFDVVAETLRRTTLGRLRGGDRVNLEPALTAGGRLDGHIVQGHVDGVAEVARIETSGREHRLVLSAGGELTGGMVAKGSVAVAGVSLTLVDVAEASFSVALIPETLAATTLGALRVSDPVNVELDILGKYVRRYLEGLAGAEAGLTLAKLRRSGFA